jgi:hypothetical protein
VVTYFQNVWQGMSPDRYRALLAGDFAFDFASGDSAGTYYSTSPWGRADEESCAVHIFLTGTRGLPPATSITVAFVTAPTDSSDPRPGMNPRWHRLITANALVRIFFAESGFELSGACRFFVVRGDSARIPPDQLAAGAKPDSARWWLEQWADGTLHTVSAEPATVWGPFVPGRRPPRTPTKLTSWGSVKALYR